MNVTDFRRYQYVGLVVRIVDGDTFEVRCDLGFDPIESTKRIRVLFADAPERRGPTRIAGLAATVWLSDRLLGQRVWIRTHKDRQNRERWLAEVGYAPDERGELRDLADDMIALAGAVRTDEYGKALEL